MAKYSCLCQIFYSTVEGKLMSLRHKRRFIPHRVAIDHYCLEAFAIANHCFEGSRYGVPALRRRSYSRQLSQALYKERALCKSKSSQIVKRSIWWCVETRVQRWEKRLCIHTLRMKSDRSTCWINRTRVALRVLLHSTCVKAVGRRCIGVRKFRLLVDGELSDLHLHTSRWIRQMRRTPLRELERHLAQCEHRRLIRAPHSILIASVCRKYIIFLLNECFVQELFTWKEIVLLQRSLRTFTPYGTYWYTRTYRTEFKAWYKSRLKQILLLVQIRVWWMKLNVILIWRFFSQQNHFWCENAAVYIKNASLYEKYPRVWNWRRSCLYE